MSALEGRLIPPPASTPQVRKVMQGNRARDTKPELIVRRLVTSLGYRYRLHRKDLPGKPDLVFGIKRKVVFVHGCFWHRHARCSLARPLKSNLSYWVLKLARNNARDIRTRRALTRLGWGVLIVRECELGDLPRVAARLSTFLAS